VTPSEPTLLTEDRQFLSGPRPRGSELLRVLRIALEFIQGFRKLHFVGPCVTVFGSARTPETNAYYGQARQVGRLLAEQGFTVMTGGGPGIMEAVARGAKEAGGRTVGCNIWLPIEQPINNYLDEWITFRHFFVRKVMLLKYSYAFIAFPGGFGTMDEIFETATLIQTGKIRDFPLMLMGPEFWGPLIAFLKGKFLLEGTIDERDFGLLTVCTSPSEAVEQIASTVIKRFNLTYGPRAKKRRFLFE
jgi:uncharacterized protein (TIGR00730 family)